MKLRDSHYENNTLTAHPLSTFLLKPSSNPNLNTHAPSQISTCVTGELSRQLFLDRTLTLLILLRLGTFVSEFFLMVRWFLILKLNIKNLPQLEFGFKHYFQQQQKIFDFLDSKIFPIVFDKMFDDEKYLCVDVCL